jgi:hypothetical protein
VNSHQAASPRLLAYSRDHLAAVPCRAKAYLILSVREHLVSSRVHTAPPACDYRATSPSAACPDRMEQPGCRI